MVIGKTKRVGNITDCEIGICEKKIGTFNFLAENIMLETDAGYFFEISGQVLVIITEMTGDVCDLQVFIDKGIDVINDIIVQLLSAVYDAVFLPGKLEAVLVGDLTEDQCCHIIQVVGVIS